MLPTADEISQAVAVARQRHWRLDAQRRTARHLSGAPLVLNSLTKSYIIERAVGRALAAGELETVMTNLGGDIVVRGAHAVRLAVADPEADAENDLPLTHVGVSDRAVATSGGYRRGVDIGGHGIGVKIRNCLFSPFAMVFVAWKHRRRCTTRRNGRIY